MYHIIYLSQAATTVTDELLQELLQQARTFNAAHDITGILLYGNGQFLQLLEGEQAVLELLYARIRQDARHRDVTTYASKEVAMRAFPEWSMAYQAFNPQQFVEFAGLISPAELQLERPGLLQADQHLLALLRSFVLPA